ncbi:MAG: serine hydrolase [Kiloniellales bacterium]
MSVFGKPALGCCFAAAVIFGFGPATAEAPPPETVADTIPASQIEAALSQLDGLSEEIMRETGLPGLAVAVVLRGELVFAKGYGRRSMEADALVDADTVFQIASLSKPIAATVVAQQVGKGRVAWDSPVAALLPNFALSDPWVGARVTLGDLFSHRSGLPDHAGDDLEDLGYDRKTILERLRLLPLAPFRLQELYTNFGLTAAAEAVAHNAGTDWASLSAAVIYRPLGMTRTSSRYSDYLEEENRALGHIAVGDGFRLSPGRTPDAQSPAGGISSSVIDFAKWMIMVLAQGQFEAVEVVDAEALLEATTPKIISRQPNSMQARASTYGYGFGVSVQPSARVVLSHSGAFYLGAGSNMMLLPSEELGIVAFSNASPVGAVEALTASFMDLVQFGAPTRDWLSGYRRLMAALVAPRGALLEADKPAEPEPPLVLSSYTGRYANAYFGEARIEERDGDLHLLLGPRPVDETLKHWDGSRFTYAPLTENLPEGSLAEVSFEQDAQGRVTGFLVDLLNEEGLGRFTREP